MYHPNAGGGFRQTQVETSWWKNLGPLMLQKCAPIMDVSVHLSRNEKRLPKKKDCEAMTSDLVRLAETVVGNGARRRQAWPWTSLCGFFSSTVRRNVSHSLRKPN